MKRYYKLLVSLLLALVIIFNTAACDVLTSIPGLNLDFGTQEPGGDAGDVPADDPDENPADKPNEDPTDDPDENPTDKPNEDPTDDPDKDPTDDPNEEPTDKPDEEPTDKPNENPNNPSDKDPSDGNDGAFDGEDDPIEEPEYVFGSEYAELLIPVSAALDKAQEYTSAASNDTYYILVKIDSIVSLSKGNMYVSDETGSIYIYSAKDKDGNSLSYTDIAVGDIAVIAGPLRNYNGELEIEKGKVLSYYTPGVDTPTKPEDKPTEPDNPDDNIGSGTDTPSDDIPGGTITWPTPDDPITSDPYEGVDVDAFYADYRPAVSYMDAYYRSKHYLMSGSIEKQDQAPTISEYRPMEDGKYVRNTTYLYSADGNTYYVVNAYGEVVKEIYRGGAYIVLEEVAAYVFAFGEIPANHTTSKKASPSSNPWGIYLRLNHSSFSGDTSRYRYEPELPNISGCGGALFYYEMDIGTTGTDCDPSYPVTDYNNGSRIERGAARIVYARMDLDRDGAIEVGETYLFYTYNHYNDFQEYLNYEGGWGELFGNITGGGKLSSNSSCNPTPYVPTAYAAFVTDDAYTVVVFCLPKREEA